MIHRGEAEKKEGFNHEYTRMGKQNGREGKDFRVESAEAQRRKE